MSGGFSKIQVHLYRDGLSTPWGFRVKGGKDLNSALHVEKVSLGSPAEGEVKIGDILTKVDSHDVSNLTHVEALDVLKKTGGNVVLQLKRTGIKPRKDKGSDIGSMIPLVPKGWQISSNTYLAQTYRPPGRSKTPPPSPSSQGYRTNPLVLPSGKSFAQSSKPGMFGQDYSQYSQGAPPRQTQDDQMVHRLSASLGQAAAQQHPGSEAPDITWQPRATDLGLDYRDYGRTPVGRSQSQRGPRGFNQQAPKKFSAASHKAPACQPMNAYQPPKFDPTPSYQSPPPTQQQPSFQPAAPQQNYQAAPQQQSYQAAPQQQSYQAAPQQQSYQPAPQQQSYQPAPQQQSYQPSQQQDPLIKHTVWKPPPKNPVLKTPEFGWTPSWRTGGKSAPQQPQRAPAQGEVEEPQTPAWSGTLRNTTNMRAYDQSAPQQPAPQYSPQGPASPKQVSFQQDQPDAYVPVHQPRVQDTARPGQAGPGGDGARVVHLQYNTPIGLYSKDNVKETLTGQTRGKPGQGTMQVTSAPGFAPKKGQPFSPATSATYALLQEQEGHAQKPMGYGLPENQQQHSPAQQQHSPAGYQPQSQSMRNLEHNMQNVGLQGDYGASDF
ncbi:unnamed protein product [Owenia fusiformis]|uniref:PDZ domain-containing protein n=1 Tax=Owenia fusiformis TaxID=6347 RepID=A0A8S4PPJ3_OWEFU|nr:unnamed protein product [Owenia fusiformis]